MKEWDDRALFAHNENTQNAATIFNIKRVVHVLLLWIETSKIAQKLECLQYYPYCNVRTVERCISLISSLLTNKLQCPYIVQYVLLFLGFLDCVCKVKPCCEMLFGGGENVKEGGLPPHLLSSYNLLALFQVLLESLASLSPHSICGVSKICCSWSFLPFPFQALAFFAFFQEVMMLNFHNRGRQNTLLDKRISCFTQFCLKWNGDEWTETESNA